LGMTNDTLDYVLYRTHCRELSTNKSFHISAHSYSSY
jgi:hypothetical protein